MDLQVLSSCERPQLQHDRVLSVYCIGRKSGDIIPTESSNYLEAIVRTSRAYGVIQYPTPYITPKPVSISIQL
jgi:hypothetical protein|tara:strand:+ start:332 stop:550 length:219 start_codon:yes stop_codon:yes gene_type:complete